MACASLADNAAFRLAGLQLFSPSTEPQRAVYRRAVHAKARSNVLDRDGAIRQQLPRVCDLRRIELRSPATLPSACPRCALARHRALPIQLALHLRQCSESVEVEPPG